MNDISTDWGEYEKVYNEQTTILSRLISTIPSKDLTSRQELNDEAQNCIVSANRAVDDMQQLLRLNRSLTRDQTEKFRQKIKLYKTQLLNQQRDLSRAMSEQRGPSSGLQGYNNDSYNKDERRKLLHGNEVIDSTGNALMKSKQVIAQTEDIANATSQQLYDQGGQLENTLADLHETNAISDRARRVMIGMARRVYTDRIIQFFIVLIEFGIVGFLVYWKFFKKN